MKIFLKVLSALTLIVIFSCGNSYAATTTSVSQNLGLNFGTLSAGTGGTIKTNGTAVTGGVKSLGGGVQNGSFIVTGTNATTGPSRTLFKVFITGVPASLTSSGNTANVAVSLSSTSVVTSQTYNFSSGNGTRTLTIPTYGTLTVSGTQAAGSYSGSHNVVACNCTFGSCPTTSCL
jgi:hypothetical protein